MSARTPDSRQEQEFTEAIGRAATAYRLDSGELAERGWQYGRRLRRRRRTALLGGAAALALTGLLGASALGLPGGSGGGGAGPGDRASGPAVAAVTGPQFQAMLTELLPAGRLVEVGEARGTDASSIPQLRLVWDDGHGAVQYLFSIMRGALQDTDCSPGAPAGDSCTVRTLPDGTKVRLYTAGTRDGEPAGARMASALATTPDGYQLMLQEWNRLPLAAGTPITRPEPPLDADQLVALIGDPRWQRVERAIRNIRIEVLPSGTVTHTYGG